MNVILHYDDNFALDTTLDNVNNNDDKMKVCITHSNIKMELGLCHTYVLKTRNHTNFMHFYAYINIGILLLLR